MLAVVTPSTILLGGTRPSRAGCCDSASSSSGVVQAVPSSSMVTTPRLGEGVDDDTAHGDGGLDSERRTPCFQQGFQLSEKLPTALSNASSPLCDITPHASSTVEIQLSRTFACRSCSLFDKPVQVASLRADLHRASLVLVSRPPVYPPTGGAFTWKDHGRTTRCPARGGAGRTLGRNHGNRVTHNFLRRTG